MLAPRIDGHKRPSIIACQPVHIARVGHDQKLKALLLHGLSGFRNAIREPVFVK